LFKSSYHFLAAGVPETPRLALVYGNGDTLLKGIKTRKRFFIGFREMPFRFAWKRDSPSENASKDRRMD
jgi:hypothetical protein